jgi:hypothetical protein
VEKKFAVFVLAGLFPEIIYSFFRKQNCKSMHSSVAGDVFSVFFFQRRLNMLTFFVSTETNVFFRHFFKIILIPTTLQMEKEKSTDTQRTDKKLAKTLSKIDLRHQKSFELPFSDQTPAATHSIDLHI